MNRLASTYKYAVRVFDPNIGYPPIDGIVSQQSHPCHASGQILLQGWLSGKIKEKLRDPKENHTTAMKFKEFVTFLLDKAGAFKEVKRDFNASFYFMDDHWSSYYK